MGADLESHERVVFDVGDSAFVLIRLEFGGAALPAGGASQLSARVGDVELSVFDRRDLRNAPRATPADLST